MIAALLPSLALSLLPAAPGRTQSTEVESRILSVDVYPNTALVTRVGTNPAGDGHRTIRGLPGSLVPDSVRLRAPGAEIVSLEVRERFEKKVSPVEVDAAKNELERLVRAIQSKQDEIGIVDVLEGHYRTLLAEQAKGDAATSMTPQQRAETLESVRVQLSALAKQRRELGWELADLDSRKRLVEQNISRFERGETTRVYDLEVELLDTDGAPDELEIEYQVTGARWEPYYDVRAAADLSGVEIAYRARVFQQTGEDWKGVDLALSTALPRRGLAAPEARIRWVDIYDQPARGYSAPSESVGTAWDRKNDLELGDDSMYDAGLVESERGVSVDALRAASGQWAAILADGVNLRYALPKPQDVVSRPDPTSVLVGSHDLEVEMERVALPEFDLSVWLRGRAKNTTPWVLLEGDASVYVGSDFLGTTRLARVQTGAEFDVPLGQDPGVTVERVQTEDHSDRPGLFGSKIKQYETFRIALTNTTRSKLTVFVHESLPRPRDERVEVRVDRAVPSLATGERWTKLRDERGLVTFEVPLAAGEARTVEYRVEISYPESKRIYVD
ncbi:MAG: DUF4139 domain-containing protein [Planctomycetota bacterium]